MYLSSVTHFLAILCLLLSISDSLKCQQGIQFYKELRKSESLYSEFLDVECFGKNPNCLRLAFDTKREDGITVSFAIGRCVEEDCLEWTCENALTSIKSVLFSPFDLTISNCTSSCCGEDNCNADRPLNNMPSPSPPSFLTPIPIYCTSGAEFELNIFEVVRLRSSMKMIECPGENSQCLRVDYEVSPKGITSKKIIGPTASKAHVPYFPGERVQSNTCHSITCNDMAISEEKQRELKNCLTEVTTGEISYCSESLCNANSVKRQCANKEDQSNDREEKDKDDSGSGVTFTSYRLFIYFQYFISMLVLYLLK